MRDPYLYLDSDVLKNLAGIQDSEELKNMEADYTMIRLLRLQQVKSGSGKIVHSLFLSGMQ